MQRPVDILVTGKIRDARVFQQAVATLVQLRSTGAARRILFSGWNQDFAEQPAVIDWLQQLGVETIDNGADLPVRSCGNYWEQVKTLEGGLERIEDGVRVFKTRTDLLYYGGMETLQTLLREHAGETTGQHGFRQRIWIPSFVALQPFFMADQCYLGLAEDLRRFLRYDADVEAQGRSIALYPGSATHPAAASAEIRFWLQPFLEEFPALREYRSVWPESMNGYPHYRDLQAFNLASPFYQEYLAIYWTVLDRVFRVSEGRFCIAHAIEDNGRIVVRANAHANNSTAFIEDACGIQGNYPLSYSTDLGLRTFLEAGRSAFYGSVYAPALARVLNHKQTPERQQSFQHYLGELRRRARHADDKKTL